MSKDVKIDIKNTIKTPNEKPPSDASLIESSKNIDKALEKRKKDKESVEEFTEWK
ncbi:hypothetical protein [Marinobacter xestospongiae]|uniref:Uncharacterized protein n=1 Tax=Marinobacter xestospongiae TaxID=994319 RepID=A0ABU3W4X6_9GAMM|nr:hypothetical protein [Marinobacter xestospongiae]MDV2081066.1 hypothetical protein [Marinobacter xestospongiae]